MNSRRAVVGVMGAGEGASAEAEALALELGECISARGWVLLTGGRPAGVMAAASRGEARVEGHLVVGGLPDEGSGEERQSTAELDLALFTGMGKARTVINVLSADVVVICGGRRQATDPAGGAAPMARVLLLARRGGTERERSPPCVGVYGSTADSIERATVASPLKKLVGPLRRATIYGLFSYGGLVLINNSELDLPNMWIAYLPMFIGVYVVTQWLDKKLGD